MSDAELVDLCRTQLPYSTETFEKLVRRYEARVFRTCWRMLRSREQAEEATQDAFLGVFNGLQRFEGRSSFSSWLFRIVKNVCARYYERSRREEETQAEYKASALLGDASAENWPVSEALEQLTPQEREVIVLRHISELSLQEIAEALDLSLSAAKMRLYRANDRFREAYASVTGKKE